MCTYCLFVTLFYLFRYFFKHQAATALNCCFLKRESYILHVSREALGCGGDGALHFPQEVLFRLRTAHVLLGHKVSKTPAGIEETIENYVLLNDITNHKILNVCKEPKVIPEQCIDGHLLPRDALPQHVVGEGREAEERLQDGVHVAGVAEVGEPVTYE